MPEEIKSLCESLGFKIFFNKSLILNKAFILYNIGHDTYSFNLSGFIVYDILVDLAPKELLTMLLKHNDSMYDTNKLNSRYELLDQLRNNKIHYEIFKQIINIEKIFIDSTINKPIKQKLICENGKTYLNLYDFNNDFEKVKPELNNDFPLIKEFLLNLFGQDENFYNKFIEVCAWKIQKPLQMLSQCNFIVQDNGGTGKSEIFLDMILNKLFNVKPINQSILESDNNSYMINSQWVVVEEVEGFKDAKKIKSLTGAKTIMINEKYVPIYESINYTNFIIFSNESKTLHIDENDRRFNVGGGGVRLSPLPSKTWKDTYFKSEENNISYFEKFHKNINSELKKLYSHLIALNVTRSKVQQLVNTKQRTDLINLNKSSAFLLLDEIHSSGFDGLINLLDYNVKIHELIISHNKENYILFKDLYNIYKKYHNSYMGLNSNPIGKNGLMSKLKTYTLFDSTFEDIEILTFIDKTTRGLKLIKQNNVMNEDLNKDKITTNLNKKQ